MGAPREVLEIQLNDSDPGRRREALTCLCAMAESGAVSFRESRQAVNLHCHTTYSYNGYGFSPSYIVWRARCEGLLAVGCVDFDVLDAVDEFLEACRLTGIRGCAGFETRVFVPAFSSREMNSPGEPGIAYFMGLGFCSSKTAAPEMLERLKTMAQERNRRIMERVNAYLAPLVLDYENEVLPLTPNGNATERHLCAAYDAKSRALFSDAGARAAFWAEKLGGDAAALRASFADPPLFQGTIRAKTMKSGGVGYVKPAGPDFPTIESVSRFVLDAGAIPAYAWLDGTTAGELRIDELLDSAAACGAAALNIIPDRNWNIKNAAQKKIKIAHLYAVVERARERGLPIAVGTEMNAYGQKFCDDFDAAELAPVASAFVDGAYLLYAHTALQSRAEMGYLSAWARERFSSVHDKNAFFIALGKLLKPARANLLDAVTGTLSPAEVLTRARSS